MKNMKAFLLALATVLVPAFTLTSCSDDEEEKKGGEEIIEIRPTDGVEFVKNCWVLYDENGNFVCLSQGKALNEAEPTVAYVGVTDLEEAKQNFLGRLVPRDAKYVENGDNITVSLTDTLGKEQNKVFFTAVGDGETIATVKLEKRVGIEQYVSEFRYIDKKLWPENSTGDSFFQEGHIYTYDHDNYVCIKAPEAGQNGILFRDCGERVVNIYDRSHYKERFLPQFPSMAVFEEVDAKLLGNEGNKYLKLLNVCCPEGEINNHVYWTSMYDRNYFYVYDLTSHKKIRRDPWYLSEFNGPYYKASSCDIMVGENGLVVSRYEELFERQRATYMYRWRENFELEMQVLSK